MLSRILHFFAIIFNSKLITAYPTITAHDIHDLRVDLRQAFDESTIETPEATVIQPLIASTVQLAFHDCSGRSVDYSGIMPSIVLNTCDGCLDFSDPNNYDLEEKAFQALEDVYQLSDHDWDSKMSRADFWMASATIALEVAAANQYTITSWDHSEWKPAPLEDIPFYFGRTDCATSPNAEEHVSIPPPSSGWNSTLKWFDEFFDFDEEDVVAIMGAHTLGSATHSVSGFCGQWTQHPHVLNNEYYWSLSYQTGGIYDAEFQQYAISELEPSCMTNDTLNEGDNVQWIRTFNDTQVEGQNGERFLMLNIDLSLSMQMDRYLDSETGEVLCDAPSLEYEAGAMTVCPQQIEDVWEEVDEYAIDNEEWLEEFAEVFEEMVTVHLDTDLLQQLIVPYDRSFQVIVTEYPVTTGYGDGDGYGDIDTDTDTDTDADTETAWNGDGGQFSSTSTESTTSSTESEIESTSSTESEVETRSSTSSSELESTSTTEMHAFAIAMRHGFRMSTDPSTNKMKERALKYIIGPGVGAFFVTAMYVIYKRRKMDVLSAEVSKSLVNNNNIYGSIGVPDQAL